MRIRKQQLNQMGTSLRMEKIADLLQQKGLAVSQVDKKNLLLINDAEDRQAQIAFNDKNSMAVKTALGRQYKIKLDDQGKANTFTDPSGLTISETNSHNNQLTTIHRGSDTEYKLVHDQKGRLRQIRYPDNTDYKLQTDGRNWQETDRNGQLIHYVFDNKKRLNSVIDSRNNTTQYDYDENGHAHRIRLADGKIYEYDVDEDGLPSSWRINGREHAGFDTDGEKPGLNINYADGHQIRYLMNGNKIIEAETSNFILKLEYDDNDNLLFENQNGQIVQYEYDKTHLLTAIITPDEERIEFHRNLEGKIDKVVDWNQQEILIEYQLNGQIKNIHYPNGVITSIESNQSGLDHSIHTQSSLTNQILLHQVLNRDQCDRVIGVSEQNLQRQYQYDNEGHLIAVKSSNSAQNENFELDAMANYKSINSINCQYDKLNQMTSYGSMTVQHDLLGNTIQAPTASGDLSFTFNGQGSLTKAQLTDGSEAVYEYDPLGRRVKKTVNQITTEYIWAGFTLLSERVIEGQGEFKQRDHLFLSAAFLPLSMRLDGELYQQHTDHRMACTALTDNSGEVVWQAEYNAFGEAVIVVSQVDNPWRLMNQYYDNETGLHYNLARYYNPLLGRYMSPDPLLEKGGSLNYYLYARSDPINNADPTGLFLLMAIAVGFVAGAVIAAGMEAYKQYNSPGTLGDKAAAVAKKALIGGVVGAIGGLIGGLAVMGGAAVAGVSVAALEAGSASLGVIAAIGATEGVAGGLAEVCAEAAIEGRSPTATELAIAVVVGGGVGSVTAGIGGLWAQRATRKALADGGGEVAEKTAKELVEETVEEGSEKTSREAAEDATEKAAREMAEDARVRKSIGEAAEASRKTHNGIKPKHQDALSDFAVDNKQVVIVRNGNPSSLQYQGKPGHTAKPVTCKAKTAKYGPDTGLVVDPTNPVQKGNWDAAERLAKDDPEELSKVLANRKKAEDSWATFKKDELDVEGSPYSVDDNGRVLLDGDKVHGDYDLHGVYDNKTKSQIDYGSGLEGHGDEAAAASRRKEMNELLGDDMVLHGGQDDWIPPPHPPAKKMEISPDPPATAFLPDGTIKTLATEADMKDFYKKQGLDWPYPKKNYTG